MKQRFSSLDVKVIAHELNEALVSLRVSNIYDLSSKILLFKLAKPDNKKQFVIDAGFRCHITEFARTTAHEPSAFVAQLRKFLKTRRVTSVSQVGSDRVLQFQFSDGQYRMFLEFFASGNIILTDADLKILALQRNVPEGEGQEPQRQGLTYRLDNRQHYNGTPPFTPERVKEALKISIDKARATTKAAAAATKKKSKSGDDLRRALAVSLPELPPMLIEHALAESNFDTLAPVDAIHESETLLLELHKALQRGLEIIGEITQSQTATGYIIAKKQVHIIKPLDSEAATGAEATTKEVVLFDDFHPFLPNKFADNPNVTIIKIDGFNKTVDDFFSSIEGQKLESRLNEREANARRKLDAAKQDQAKRLEGLANVVTLNLRKAAVIEANMERVQEAMEAVNDLVAQGMDWEDIGKLIEREQQLKNPIAEVIKLPLKLGENVVQMLLSEEVDDGDSENEDDGNETASSVSDSESEPESETPSKKKNTKNNAKGTSGKSEDKRLTVDINLKLSPWSNAREYYDQKRTAAEKQQKTAEQSAIALKNAQVKIKADLKRGLKTEKPILHQLRVPFWFEKFLWFISSDGYLVLGSKDSTQAEMLYTKHLKKGDIWVSADMSGACSIVIKNDHAAGDAPIPPSTLGQAGTLAVASSDAWDSKAGMGAWWVKAEGLTKRSAAGDFLPAGQVLVTAEKNFLPPPQLLIGFGVFFKVSLASAAKNHSKHRVYTPVERKEKPRHQGVEEEVEGEGEVDEKVHEDELKDEPKDELETSVSKEEALETPADEAHDDDEEEPTKKNNPLSGSGPSTDDVSSQIETLSIAPSTITSAPEKRAPLKRGHKAKLKKIATKYKDQDDEDRAAAAIALGATAGRAKAEAEAAAKVAREAEIEAARARRRAQHERHQREAAKHEEKRRLAAEKDEGEESYEIAGRVDVLVGTPAVGDEILEVVPVAGPWSAMGLIKYKVKLQPGGIKKGKAMKEILERWKGAAGVKGAVDEKSADVERVWPREMELIKGLRAEEVVNVVPVGKVRAMLSGGKGGGGGSGGSGKGKKK